MISNMTETVAYFWGFQYIVTVNQLVMKKGQIVKFNTSLEDEDPLQEYVLLEIFEDALPPRAKIMALNTGLPFPPINSVRPSDLEVVEDASRELKEYILKIGYELS